MVSLLEHLDICCKGLDATATEVIEKLLSKENINDIKTGDISKETIRAHIKVWIEDGKKSKCFNDC